MLSRKKESYNKVDYKYNNKEEEEKSRGKLLVIYALFLVLLGSCVVVYISQSMQMMQLNTQINQVQSDLEDVEEDNHQLALKLSNKMSLSRIEEKARQKLSMEKPEQSSSLVMYDGNQDDSSNKPQDFAEGREDSFFLADLAQDFWKKISVVRAESEDVSGQGDEYE
ncbi:MAG: cell division protein FtsL [Halanaerobiaceae bacterium]